jgi:uncharacterized membrane protein
VNFSPESGTEFVINYLSVQLQSNLSYVTFQGYSAIWLHKTGAVKPVLRGQFWKKKQWLYKTGDLLKEVPFEIVYDRTSQK